MEKFMFIFRGGVNHAHNANDTEAAAKNMQAWMTWMGSLARNGTLVSTDPLQPTGKQVNGKNKTTFSEMIAMDIHYAEHMSIWLDLSIIFKTIPALLGQTFESRIRRNSVMSGTPVSARR